MRMLMIIGNFIVIACLMIICLTNTYELYLAYQFSKIQSLFGVIAVGAIFLMGYINIIINRAKKLPVGIPSKIAVFMCLALFAWANIVATQ